MAASDQDRKLEGGIANEEGNEESAPALSQLQVDTPKSEIHPAFYIAYVCHLFPSRGAYLD
jgi:hypothetical protein